MKKAARSESMVAGQVDVVPVVRVYVDGLSVRTASSFVELGTSSPPQVRFMLVNPGWEFPPERSIAVDDGASVRSATRSKDGRQLLVQFKDFTSFVVDYTITIQKQGQCLYLVSAVEKFGIVSNLPAAMASPSYVITVKEEKEKIYVSPTDLEVNHMHKNVLITWKLISTNFRFASNGIQIVTKKPLEFQPDFKSDNVFRLMNKNSSTKEFKYDVNLVHTSGSLLLNCDPTIKNGTR